MKQIFCFGDSNTWGFNPITHGRYEYQERWLGIVQNRFGNDYRIIEEGLNGRTTVWQDPIEGYKSGKDYLIPCLETHSPLDLVIIMLGTNNLKKRFSLSAYDIAVGAAVLVDLVSKSNCGNQGKAPDILLIAPTTIGDLNNSWLADMFGREQGTITSHQLAQHFSRVAENFGCYFLDAALIAEPCAQDAIHFDLEGHQKIGLAIAVSFPNQAENFIEYFKKITATI